MLLVYQGKEVHGWNLFIYYLLDCILMIHWMLTQSVKMCKLFEIKFITILSLSDDSPIHGFHCMLTLVLRRPLQLLYDIVFHGKKTSIDTESSLIPYILFLTKEHSFSSNKSNVMTASVIEHSVPCCSGQYRLLSCSCCTATNLVAQQQKAVQLISESK